MDTARIEGEVEDPRPAAAEPVAGVAAPGAAPAHGRPTSAAGVMALQRLVGNAAVAGMLQGQNPADLLPEPDTQRAAPPDETTAEEGEAAEAAPAPEQQPAPDGAAPPAGPQAGPGGVLGQLSWLPPEVAAAIAEQAEQADTQQAAADGGARKAEADASAAAASAAVQAGGGAAAAKAPAGGAAAAAGGAAGAAVAGGAPGAAPGGAAAGGAAKDTAGGGAAGAAAGGAAGAAGGGAAGAAAGGAAAAVSGEPAPRVDPKDDPNFNAMQARTTAAGTKTKSHEPAAAGAAAAQGAAVPPGNDVASQAQAAQVEVMGEQEPGGFDRAAFIAAVKKSIEAATPKNLKEVSNFKESGKAAKVKGEVGGLVKGGKQASEKDMKSATVAPPDPSKATPKTVVPMENEEPGTATKTVGAAAAMPQTRPEEDTDLSSGPAEVEQTLEENQVTEEQLQKSNEPEFTEALDARQQASEHAETAPAEFRQQEEETLGQARDGAEVAAAAKLEGMQGSRAQALAKVVGHKGETKSKDEEKRAKVAADIQAIYERTKTDVTTTLDAIDPKVDEIFTKGEEGARTEFEEHVSARMSAYKKKRYSGWRGKLRWAKDKLFGMPDAVNAFYEEGKKTYLQRMEGVIGQVADVVGEGLTTARQRIADGRAEVRKYVAQLPTDLQKVGKEAEEKLDAQFEELESDVDAKQGALVDTLAQKYLEARDALDARIEELKEANKGLVQKAIDKVVGVAKAIWRLKDMLLNVIAKAVSVIGDIISDPIGFFGNLVSAFAGGFNRFMGNIARHLQEGLTRWLFGTLGEAGIQMPKTFDLSGVFELVMQLLGLTYQNIRERVAKQVGEENVAKLEEKVDIFQAMAGKGLAGLWEFVKEKIGNFEDVVLGALKDFVIERVIKAGVPTLLAMLNPATAFIRACIAIYDFVMWLIDKGNEIMELINSLLDSISAIARGSIGEAVDYIESTLAKALPLAISLLASVMRLGGLPEKIKSVIETVRKPVRKAVDTVIMGAVKGAKSLFGRPAAWVKGKYEAGKKWATDKVEAGKEWVGGKVQGVKELLFGKAEKGFSMAGAPHTLTATPEGRVVMASRKPGDLLDKARKAAAAQRAAGNTAVADAIEKYVTDTGEPELAEYDAYCARPVKGENKDIKAEQTVRTLAAGLTALGEQHNVTDLSHEALGVGDLALNRLVYGCIIAARKQILDRRARARGPGDPPVPAEQAEPDDREFAEKLDAMVRETSVKYDTACKARVPAGKRAASFGDNTFMFRGRKYFVDHDANYLIPDEDVGTNRGKGEEKSPREGKMYVWPEPVLKKEVTGEEVSKDPVRQPIIDRYAYTDAKFTISHVKRDAELLTRTRNIDAYPEALFLAAMLAEARRNPNAVVTNLLLLAEQDSKEQFYKVAPMTEGGTSEEDKFRDPSLPDPRLDDKRPPREGQAPMEVSDKEIALVRARYERLHGTPLEEIIKTYSEQWVAADLEKFLVAETKI